MFFLSLSFPLQISAVRLPREPSNPERLKGFGYAEFDDVDSLLRALSLSEEVRGINKDLCFYIFLFFSPTHIMSSGGTRFKKNKTKQNRVYFHH